MSRIASFFRSFGGYVGPGTFTRALGGRVENAKSTSAPAPPSLADAFKRKAEPPARRTPTASNTAPPPPSLADAIKKGNRR